MSAHNVLETLMEVLSEDDARAVIEHRRHTIKKPLTVRAASNLAKQFAQVPDPTLAVDLMIDRCWQGFRAEWLYNQQSSEVVGRMRPATAQLLSIAGGKS